MDWPGMTKKIDVEVSTLLDKLVTDITPLLATNPIIIGIPAAHGWQTFSMTGWALLSPAAVWISASIVMISAGLA
jgi:hypothetical protein